MRTICDMNYVVMGAGFLLHTSTHLCPPTLVEVWDVVVVAVVVVVVCGLCGMCVECVCISQRHITLDILSRPLSFYLSTLFPFVGS
jgi:hypothetical protein